MSMILTLDFETHDPLLKTVGAGWAFPNRNPIVFHVLGAAVKVDQEAYLDLRIDNDEREKQYLFNLLDDCDIIVMHNAMYDLGCLHWLGFDIKKIIHKVHDTLIMAKLHDNRKFKYDLDSLASLELNVKKETNLLEESVLGIEEQLGEKPINIKTKTWRTKAKSMAYKHLSKLQELKPDIVAKYAIKDVIITKKLYDKLIKQLDIKLVERYSKAVGISCLMRIKGIRIDLEYLQDLATKMKLKLDDLESKILKEFSQPVNLRSPVQLIKALEEAGAKLTKDEKKTTDKEQLEKNKEKVFACKLLLEHRKLNKLYNDFVLSILENSIYTGDRVFPQLSILGAAATGRTSCQKINIQQIPKNDEWGLRKIFLPEEGETWHSIDWSSQEPRLQVHYASLEKLNGADVLLNEYKQNPHLDLHTLVSSIAGIDRKAAKGINLGLSYGMGIGKLGKLLGFKTIKVNGKTLLEPNGQYILDKYNENFPYLKELSFRAQDRLRKNNYIRTLGGRHLYRDKDFYNQETRQTYNFDYKALNKLIQGSAADQAVITLNALYDKGILPIAMIHDEFCLSGHQKDAILTKEIMETSVELKVPVVAVVSSGSSWGDIEEQEDSKLLDEIRDYLDENIE